MKTNRIRTSLIAILIWFFVFYNIERVMAPINLASFVYLYAALLAIAILLVLPSSLQIPSLWLFLASLIPYLLIKITLGLPIGGVNLPLTVTEVSAIGLTIYITVQIERQLREVYQSVADLTIRHPNKGLHSFDTVQGQIYREIRRARRHHRPAALVAITASSASVNISLSKFILEAQQEIIKHYVNARLANLLIEELKDEDVIAQREDHFVALISEIDGSRITSVVNRLKRAAKKELGLDLQVGISTFPDEAVTFESLLINAEARMTGDEAEPSIVSNFETSLEEEREAL